MHDHVQAVRQPLGDCGRGLGGGDVQLDRLAAQALGHRLQLSGERRHVEPDDMRSVARERLCDRRPDPARRSGHQGGPSGERVLPVELSCDAPASPGGGETCTTCPDT